jgi:hypothetical protein
MQKGEIAIMAELKPYGDKQEVVAEAFANPFMNLSYSIRCITQPRNVAGRIHRIIKSIITFDKVYMPGIKHASKQNALLATTSEAYAIDEIKSLINEKDEWLGLLLCKSCKDERKEVRRKVIDYRISMFKEFYKEIKNKSSIKDPAARPHE